VRGGREKDEKKRVGEDKPEGRGGKRREGT
jgi:hypothetical protein